jgi:carbamate kinase
MNKKLVFIAIGGNSLIKSKELRTVEDQHTAIRETVQPVGEFFDKDQLAEIRRDYPDWTLVEDAGRGFRRVVASPEPREVIERPVIESLLNSGYHVVTVGGGGIPVVRTDKGLEGVDAVIDKDLASSLLANQLDAGLLIISTAVEQVALNFGKPAEKPISKMTIAEAQQYIAEGHFAPAACCPRFNPPWVS